MNKEIVLAVDLGGTNLRMAAIDSQGNISYRTKRETPREGSADEIVKAIIECANECQKNCEGLTVKAVSIAVPGSVNINEGTITKAPNLSVLNNFKIVEAIETELNVKTILENDANAAAYGESRLGASKGSLNSIFVTLGTGIGGGIIVDGKVLRGAYGTAGEIGHVCVESMGAPCGCGSRGCVEQYASASAIVRMANELKEKFPDSELNNNARIEAQDVFKAGVNDDKLALEVFDKMGFYLGIALTNLLNTLNPEIIVIGGGASAGWDLFAPGMLATIRERAFGGSSEQTKIVRCELEDDAGILGAAMLVFTPES